MVVARSKSVIVTRQQILNLDLVPKWTWPSSHFPGSHYRNRWTRHLERSLARYRRFDPLSPLAVSMTYRTCVFSARPSLIQCLGTTRSLTCNPTFFLAEVAVYLGVNCEEVIFTFSWTIHETVAMSSQVLVTAYICV